MAPGASLSCRCQARPAGKGIAGFIRQKTRLPAALPAESGVPLLWRPATLAYAVRRQSHGGDERGGPPLHTLQSVKQAQATGSITIAIAEDVGGSGL